MEHLRCWEEPLKTDSPLAREIGGKTQHITKLQMRQQVTLNNRRLHDASTKGSDMYQELINGEEYKAKDVINGRQPSKMSCACWSAGEVSSWVGEWCCKKTSWDQGWTYSVIKYVVEPEADLIMQMAILAVSLLSLSAKLWAETSRKKGTEGQSSFIIDALRCLKGSGRSLSKRLQRIPLAGLVLIETENRA